MKVKEFFHFAVQKDPGFAQFIVDHFNFRKGKTVTPPGAQCLKGGFVNSLAYGIMFGFSGFVIAIFHFFFGEYGFQILPPPGNHLFDSFHLDDVCSDSENHADTPSLRVHNRSDLKRNLILAILQKAIVTFCQ